MLRLLRFVTDLSNYRKRRVAGVAGAAGRGALMAKNKGGRPPKYEFHKLKIGESCFIKYYSEEGKVVVDPFRIWYAVRIANYRTNKRFDVGSNGLGLFIKRLK